MNISIHPLVDYFAEAPLQFLDAYEHSIDSALHYRSIHATNDNCSLVITLSGCATARLNGEEIHYKLCPGIVLHQGVNEKLQLISSDERPWSYVVLNYRHLVANENEHGIAQQCFTLNIGQVTTELKHRLRLLVDLTKQQLTPMSKLNSKANFYSVIHAMLHARQQNSRSKYSELMLQAVEYMHHRYNKPISVTQVSQLIGIERRRFAYLFERYTGMTPNHYITSFRMNRSRELLKTQHYTVSQIAQLVGYHDSFYFSRVFKKYNGISPSAYRKKHSYSYL